MFMTCVTEGEEKKAGMNDWKLNESEVSTTGSVAEDRTAG